MPQIQRFSVYMVDVKPDNGRQVVPAFFVESMAPDNIDDKVGALATPEHCIPSKIDNIVEMLAQQQNPKLLINVHGFNTPREKVLENLYKILPGSEPGQRYSRQRRRLCGLPLAIGKNVNPVAQWVQRRALVSYRGVGRGTRRLLSSEFLFRNMRMVESCAHRRHRRDSNNGRRTGHPIFVAAHRLFPRRLPRHHFRRARSCQSCPPDRRQIV